ncbi:hypothetical protein NNJEOMEG_00436 [Fundidesulfovibrio magnetotacticus]|uniref:Curli production assembly/transport component CsgG n=1 Tax=Fundidesulfovibrio magnetotacticus TaxID=2730080 RepID=A0A6V8LPY5_9BACT|nr:hypothetical protein [Fundidesulfovibrio magnetotacticus]GFK92611.1 hypothetical protein NNJEOMEG_00436 [Fundidesulfovibrio magnetotacticus]
MSRSARRILAVLCLSCCLAACKSASKSAHELADQALYQPIAYANASVPGPAVVVLPGTMQGATAAFRQRVDSGNLADAGEMEMSKAGFTVLDRANLDEIVQEIGLAANLGDAKALKVFRKGKFAQARFLVRFDVAKAERLDIQRKDFDGTLLGILVGGVVAGVTQDSGVGTAAGTAVASIKSGDEKSTWKAGLRYTVIDADTGQQVAAGLMEDTFVVHSQLKGFLGSTEETRTGLTMDTMAIRLVQMAVSEIDARHKEALNQAPAPAPAKDRVDEAAVRKQYDAIKEQQRKEREEAARLARFDGTYIGEFAGGTKGKVRLTVDGKGVEGEVSNTDGLHGRFIGTLDQQTGTFDSELNGKIAFITFKGSVSGTLSEDGTAQGAWRASGWGTEQGAWAAKRQ